MRTILFLLISLCAMGSCNHANTFQFDLGGLPKNWVKLTKNDGELVVFNPCNAANTQLSIKGNKEDYNLVFNEGDKSFEMDIVETLEVADTVFIKAKWVWTESEKMQDVRFVWVDRQKGVGRWITTYSGGFTTNFVFVSESSQNNFETIYEPCKACWGDACDEVLAEKETETVSP